MSGDTLPELVSAIFSGVWRRIPVVMTRALSAWFSRADIASPFTPDRRHHGLDAEDVASAISVRLLDDKNYVIGNSGSVRKHCGVKIDLDRAHHTAFAPVGESLPRDGGREIADRIGDPMFHVL